MNVRIRTAAALLALPALAGGLSACSGGDNAAPQATNAATSAAASQTPDPFSAQPGTDVDKNAFLS